MSGVILVNPPYKRKEAKGMSPGFSDYIKYAWYMIFASHSPIVNMAGDPRFIKNQEDRKEAIKRINDPLLVKYFSMYMMMETKKMMDEMLIHSRKVRCPLLLLYGSMDSIVDKKGCDEIYSAWNHRLKKYLIIKDGPHGKKTVLRASKEISKWIDGIK